MKVIKCAGCGEEFEVFAPSWNRKYCRACAKPQQKLMIKKWKVTHPEKVKAIKHQQYLKHKAKHQAYYGEWYRKNKARLSQKRKERYRTDETYRWKLLTNAKHN